MKKIFLIISSFMVIIGLSSCEDPLAKNQLYDLQVKCSEKAEKVFTNSNYAFNKKVHTTLNFENHYNIGKNRCIIHIIRTSESKKNFEIEENVFDVNERTNFADKLCSKDKICIFNVENKKVKENDWNSFVKKLMSE